MVQESRTCVKHKHEEVAMKSLFGKILALFYATLFLWAAWDHAISPTLGVKSLSFIHALEIVGLIIAITSATRYIVLPDNSKQ